MIADDPQPPVAETHTPTGASGAPGPLLRIIRDQRVAFLIVGGINTLVGTAWFFLFLKLLGPVVGYMVVLLCAHIAAILCAFILYRRFVFRVTGHVWRDLVRFEMVNLSALGVNLVTLPILVEFLHWPVFPAQCAIVVVYTAMAWFGHRDFSFRRKPLRPQRHMQELRP
ncbi:GtrA family protein [Mycobacterium frederiksbergense]|uniref:GtrA family protein n=1 Tax=Mycolicibacterium frederiksbergense TaxID=117567 RepID=UPI0021F38767|nr:GtrA family protein [Mycolicibacterium frederiksbergense]MCV7048149.1 GtrA family protein [Mycolicibacterium frederiksbergense]